MQTGARPTVSGGACYLDLNILGVAALTAGHPRSQQCGASQRVLSSGRLAILAGGSWELRLR